MTPRIGGGSQTRSVLHGSHSHSLIVVLLLLVLLPAPGPVHGFPMIENSVKFALERCKQFLELATFLKPSALEESEEIRRSKKICDHIILVEGDFFDGGSKPEPHKKASADDATPELKALIKKKQDRQDKGIS